MNLQDPRIKAKVTVGAIALVLVAIFATAFAFFNSVHVQVWPFHGLYSVTTVIAVSFILGLTFGTLATFLFGYFTSRRSPGVIETIQPGQRETPGRP